MELLDNHKQLYLKTSFFSIFPTFFLLLPALTFVIVHTNVYTSLTKLTTSLSSIHLYALLYRLREAALRMRRSTASQAFFNPCLSKNSSSRHTSTFQHRAHLTMGSANASTGFGGGFLPMQELRFGLLSSEQCPTMLCYAIEKAYWNSLGICCNLSLWLPSHLRRQVKSAALLQVVYTSKTMVRKVRCLPVFKVNAR